MKKGHDTEKTLIYQVWPIAWIKPQFKGDDRSAIRKIIDFLPHIAAEVGARYVWLSPIFLSYWKDHGYDIANYREIDPRFGTPEEFEELVETAKGYDVGILMDLVLNHTSTACQWFTDHPEYYCWSQFDKPGWKNIFDGGSSWAPEKNGNYLHLFSKGQADLNWFPDGPSGKPNAKLVKEFRRIVDYWVSKGVAGFRLDAMQCINKDPASSKFDPLATVGKEYRPLAAKVMNAIFNGPRKNLYLLMECLDLNKEALQYYYEHTPINAIMDNTPVNTLSITADQSVTERNLKSYVDAVTEAYKRCPQGYAHVTESHDCPRFTTAAGISGKRAIDILFGWDGEKQFIDPRTIVVFQGQELGLKNPSRKELPDEQMIELDAQTKMRAERGEALDDLRPTSRANARVAVPLYEVLRQATDHTSCLRHFFHLQIDWILEGDD